MKDNRYNDFRDLEVWQKSKELRQNIWDLCKQFPKEEQYRLSDQMIKSSNRQVVYSLSSQFWSNS